MNNKIITLEYSARQDCFHISNLEEVLKINLRNTIEKVDNDYKIIGFFETYKEASERADEIKKMQNS